jgi:hypothetical protein
LAGDVSAPKRRFWLSSRWLPATRDGRLAAVIFRRGPQWSLSDVAEDWGRYFQLLHELGSRQDDEPEPNPDLLSAVDSLPHDALFSLLAHTLWLRQRTARQAVAEQLTLAPFRSYDRPWAAGQLSLLTAATAHLGAETLRRLDADPESVRDIDASALIGAGLARAAAVLHAIETVAVVRLSSRRCDMERLLDDAGWNTYAHPPSWPGAPPGYADELWRFDLMHNPLLAVPGLEGAAANDLDRLTAPGTTLDATGRYQSRVAIRGPVGRALWLGGLEGILGAAVEALSAALSGLDTEQGDPLPRRWTEQPWQEIAVQVRVVGGLVHGGRQPLPRDTEPVDGPEVPDVMVDPAKDRDRVLLIELPLPTWRVRPIDDTVMALARLLAAVLLREIPDLTADGRVILARWAAGSPQIRAEIDRGVDAWAASMLAEGAISTNQS